MQKNNGKRLLEVIQTVGHSLSRPTDEAQPATYRQGFEDALLRLAQAFKVKLFPINDGLLTCGMSGWAQADIEKKLRETYQTMPPKAITFQDDSNVVYWQGFETALTCIATAFNINLVQCHLN